MVKPNIYSDSELITLLIDGELSFDKQKYILRKIQYNKALQRQYDLERAIRNESKKKVTSEPSEQLTNDLFNKLGFSNGEEKPLIPWVSGLKKASAFLAASLLLSIFGYYAFISVDSTEKINKNTHTEKKIPFISSKQISPKDDLKLVEKSNTNNVKKSTRKQLSVVKNEVLPQNETTENQNKSQAQDVAIGGTTTESNEQSIINKDLSLINSANNELIGKSELYNRFSNVENLFSTTIIDFEKLQQVTYKNKFGGINSDNEISIKVLNPSANSNFMTKGGLALTYYRKWKGGCKIGLEAGYENIERWSLDVANNTKTLNNSQALSISGIVRYDATSLNFADINPFAQAFFGFGTNFNYVYGGSIGLVYNPPLSRFGIQAGYEYKQFDYYFGSDNTKPMVFDKNGAIISLIIKF